MPIVSCPGCGHGISDRATTCVNCGRPLTPVATAVEPAAVATAKHAGSSARDAGQDELPFFAVSTHKFVVMCVVTLGLYQYYWFYKQWRHLARGSVVPISPFWRTFFAPFWGFSLFAHIEARAQRDHIATRWNDLVLGIAYLLLPMTWRLPDPWSLITLLAFVPLIPAQYTIDRINARHASAPLPNRGYSGPNVVGIIVGSGVVLLALAGALLSR
jgi:hypothetical protein